MTRPSKPLVNRLLSRRNALSAPDKEAMRERVLAASAPAPWSRWLRPLLVAATACLLVGVFWVAHRRGDSEFGPRGSAGPSLSLTCTKTPCALGTQLLFKPAAATQRYVSVVALAGDGRAVWYFTSIDLESNDTLTEGGVMRRGVELDAAHGAGTFEVVAVFTPTPVDQAQVKHLVETQEPAVSVVRQTLVVEP